MTDVNSVLGVSKRVTQLAGILQTRWLVAGLSFSSSMFSKNAIACIKIRAELTATVASGNALLVQQDSGFPTMVVENVAACLMRSKTSPGARTAKISRLTSAVPTARIVSTHGSRLRMGLTLARLSEHAGAKTGIEKVKMKPSKLITKTILKKAVL